MAAVACEFGRHPSDAVLRVPVAAPHLNATIASCMEAYLPIYSFSTRKEFGDFNNEKAPKLARVDSMPVVPDFSSEQRCDSPPLYGYLSDGGASFNCLPTDIHCHLDSLEPSPAFDLPNRSSYDAHVPDSSLAAVCGESGVIKAAVRRAQPRRNASDVLLYRSGYARAFVLDDGELDGDGGDDTSCSVGAGGGGAAAALEVPSRSVLETALMSMWEDRANRGLFRYDVTRCPTRVLSGDLGFIAQLNEGRATKKRPTELTVDRVLQPFDPAKFNFTKAATSEALVAFCPRSSDGDAAAAALLPPAAPLANAAAAGNGGRSSPNLVLINVSPIDYGHVLLVPRVLDQLPQALTRGTVLLALQFAAELHSPAFRVGYNSLGAYATINHLHFQSYYLSATLPCEAAATAPLPGALARPPAPGAAAALPPAMLYCRSRKRSYDDLMSHGSVSSARVVVSRLQGYPVNAFVLEALTSATTSLPSHASLEDEGDFDTAAGDGLESLATVLAVAAQRLQAANQPFNLLISDCGRRVFLFPQCFAERQAAGAIPAELLELGVNPAAFEIAGHMLLKREEDYAGASEEVACRLLAQASLSEERFMGVARMCFG